MNILLFNDNPVVRKLVALSAQKTRDNLSVVWSMEEIEESGYDLLIIDDALYSDEMFASLKEAVSFNVTLLMATRGNAIPVGFDHVINKPFLPTDLVDLFAKINAGLSSKVSEKVIDLGETVSQSPKEDPYLAIDLEESLLDLETVHDVHDVRDNSDDLDLDDLSGELTSFENEEHHPAILDHEEVAEVRGLLEDTENDELIDNEDMSSDVLNEFDFGDLDLSEENVPSRDTVLDDFEGFDMDEGVEPLTAGEPTGEEIDEDNFDFGDLDMPEEKESITDTALDDFESLDMDDEVPIPKAVAEEIDDEDFDFGELDLSEERENSTIKDEKPLSDEGLDDLELKIQEAVEELEPDDLDMEFDDSMLDGLEIETEPASLSDAFEGLDNLGEFDMLNERELKLAIGEEVEEEEAENGVEESEHTEVLDEAIELSEEVSLEAPSVTQEATHAEGVEALQTLLKALANEDVAKSLKGLNISININFGDSK
ncbi:hypothetical protein [Sulfuricurvum sp.]|uniref:hypothetical protein n=1 Tax=Sulfuricurvum sp. TaxID=2025608 RepID=UPI0035667B9B